MSLSADALDTLKRMWKSDFPIETIAAALQCTRGSVHHYQFALGLPARRRRSTRMRMIEGLVELYGPERVLRWAEGKT